MIKEEVQLIEATNLKEREKIGDTEMKEGDRDHDQMIEIMVEIETGIEDALATTLNGTVLEKDTETGLLFHTKEKEDDEFDLKD